MGHAAGLVSPCSRRACDIMERTKPTPPTTGAPDDDRFPVRAPKDHGEQQKDDTADGPTKRYDDSFPIVRSIREQKEACHFL